MGKKSPRKPRTEYIYATTRDIVDQIVISKNPKTGEICFETPMINTYSEISYERPKGPKILSRVPQNHEGATFSTTHALESSYDFICAVDTNTREINQKTVSVVGIVIFQITWVPEPGG